VWGQTVRKPPEDRRVETFLMDISSPNGPRCLQPVCKQYVSYLFAYIMPKLMFVCLIK
jgi:hypothetical protein